MTKINSINAAMNVKSPNNKQTEYKQSKINNEKEKLNNGGNVKLVEILGNFIALKTADN